jgi:sulfhydrogenase subunit delta
MLVERGVSCLGPITAGGCEARCPSLNIPCVGCRGPARDANLDAAVAMFEGGGMSHDAAIAKLATFAPTGNGGNGGGQTK